MAPMWKRWLSLTLILAITLSGGGGGVAATLSGKALLDLSNSSAVDYVFADVKFTAQWDPVADAANATSPGLLSINAPQAWTQYNVTGRGIGVAVVDSGGAAHPDLGGRLGAA